MAHRTREINKVIFYGGEDEGLRGVVFRQIRETGIDLIRVGTVFSANLQFYLAEPEVALFVVEMEDGDMVGFDYVAKLVQAGVLKPGEVALVSGDFEVRELAERHDFNFFDKGDGAFIKELIKIVKENAAKKGPRLSRALSDDTPVAV